MGEVIHARLYPSAARRAFGAGTQLVTGLMLIGLAAFHPPQSGAMQVAMLALGAFALWGGVRLWQSTAEHLELTDSALVEAGSGRVLARLDEVRDVARGALAIKPSNGFTLKLDRPGPRTWAPGLWWRIGRRVGVGGVTSGAEARFMAETIEAMLRARRGD